MITIIYLTNINLNQNELQNAIIQPLAVAPSNPKLGQIYTDSATNKIKWYNGSSWATIGVVVTDSTANGNIVVDGVEMTVYELPIASASSLGGIKVGTNLSISADGTLSSKDTKVSNLTSDAGKVVTGLENNTTLKTTNVKDLELDGITPVTGGYVKNGDTLSKAIAALDAAIKQAVEGSGEVNVNADWNATEGDALILNKPTKLSQFTNDTNFITNAVNDLVNYYKKTEVYTKTEVTELLSAIHQMDIQVVSSLPTSNISSTTIYFVPKTGVAKDAYDEYIYLASTSSWEMIGNTLIDLSDYLKKTGDASNVTTAFSAAGSRTLPTSGETLATTLGKILKYLTDLKSVAFSNSYNDLDNKPTIIKSTSQDLAAGSLSKTVSISATKVLSVTLFDATTGEQVLADVTATNSAVTVTLAEAYTNAITINVMYL